MRLKKVLPLFWAICLMAFLLYACSPDDNGNEGKYFETETTFYWDIAGGRNLGVLTFFSDGQYVFKPDGTYSWTFTAKDPTTVAAVGIAPYDGTYELLENGTKIKIIRNDNEYGPYDLTDAPNGGKRFEYDFTDFYPNIGLENCIYYSDVSYLTEIPTFTYPEELLGDLEAFEDMTNFTLDTATMCGTLEGLAESIISFRTDGSFLMTTKKKDETTQNKKAGAYSLVIEEDEITGVNLLFGSQIIMDIPFFDNVTEDEIITLDISEEEDYFILYYKASSKAVLISEFYSNANMIPIIEEEYPDLLEGLTIDADKKIVFVNVLAGQFITYTNGRYEYLPSEAAQAFGQAPSQGFYGIKTEFDGSNLKFSLNLLEDGKSSADDIVVYELKLTGDGVAFDIIINIPQEIPEGSGNYVMVPVPFEFTEQKDPVDYPLDELGELIPFETQTSFLSADGGMTLTFSPDGTYEASLVSLGVIGTGFYNLNEDTTEIKIIYDKVTYTKAITIVEGKMTFEFADTTFTQITE